MVESGRIPWKPGPPRRQGPRKRGRNFASAGHCAGVRTIPRGHGGVFGIGAKNDDRPKGASPDRTWLGLRGRRNRPPIRDWTSGGQDALRTSRSTIQRPGGHLGIEKVRGPGIDGWRAGRQPRPGREVTWLRRSSAVIRDFIARGRPEVRLPLIARATLKLIRPRRLGARKRTLQAGKVSSDSQLAARRSPIRRASDLRRDRGRRSRETSFERECGTIWLPAVPRTARRPRAARCVHELRTRRCNRRISIESDDSHGARGGPIGKGGRDPTMKWRISAKPS